MRYVPQKNIGEIVRAIKNGKIVAVPTETVYGLAVKADDIKAINRLLVLKRREAGKGKRLTMMVPDVNDINKYAHLNRKSENLIRHFLPGELTVIIPKKRSFRNNYFDHFDDIGFRVPKHKFMLKLLKKTGPLLVTSANLKGEAPCMSGKEVKQRVPGVDVIVNGKAHGGLPTTVIDLCDDTPVIKRQGGLLIVHY